GLSADGELRALRLASELDSLVGQTTVSTALLAHAVPAGYSADEWMDRVTSTLPRVTAETSATALVIYVESFVFSNDHLARPGKQGSPPATQTPVGSAVTSA